MPCAETHGHGLQGESCTRTRSHAHEKSFAICDPISWPSPAFTEWNPQQLYTVIQMQPCLPQLISRFLHTSVNKEVVSSDGAQKNCLTKADEAERTAGDPSIGPQGLKATV